MIKKLFIFLVNSIQANDVINNSNMSDTKIFYSTICKKKNTELLEIKQRGCCSLHGGVAGCFSGKIVCLDGTYSPSYTCYTPINPLG